MQHASKKQPVQVRLELQADKVREAVLPWLHLLPPCLQSSFMEKPEFHVTLYYSRNPELPLIFDTFVGNRQNSAVEVLLKAIVFDEFCVCLAACLPRNIPCSVEKPHVTLGTGFCDGKRVPPAYSNALLEKVDKSPVPTLIALPAMPSLTGTVVCLR